MKQVITLLFSVIVCCSAMKRTGPTYTPTKGEVWPQVKHEIKGKAIFGYNSSILQVTVTNRSCQILQNAIFRCKENLRILEDIAETQKYYQLYSKNRFVLKKFVKKKNHIRELQVNLDQYCESSPHLNMDESYHLSVSRISFLNSSSIWGILRGLETFTQLFYLTDNYQKVVISSTYIVDYPSYPHRGLMLDTSNHYVSVNNILTTLDAMAMNKLNVFHWHIVDDASFPLKTKSYPGLSEMGAYALSLIYDRAEIKKVKKYARNRGIRVIPEINIPGHTRSWGQFDPELLTKCPDRSLGPLNPAKNNTYELLRGLFAEIQELFPDKYLHLGGDDVDLNCWANNHEVVMYMKNNSVANANQLLIHFFDKVMSILQEDVTTIVRQEVFNAGVFLNDTTLVEVKKYRLKSSDMLKLEKSNLGIIVVDNLDTNTFSDLYDWNIAHNPMLKNILGGELTVWTQKIGDSNIFSQVWPKACATAEVLWSKKYSSNPVKRPAIEVYRMKRRLEEQWCRLKRYGISAAPPSEAGFCITYS